MNKQKTVRLWTLFILSVLTVGAYAQFTPTKIETPSFAIKSNLLYDATASMNLGVEFKLSNKWTLEVPVSYNPWTFSDNKKWKHVLVQPEARWWLCEAFNGHFLGLHGHYASYNVGNVDIGSLKDYRYEGWLAGAGVSYGYQFYLGRRFNLELALGVGYAYIKYDKYKCATCGDFVKSDHKNYFGPTKAAITLVYLLK